MHLPSRASAKVKKTPRLASIFHYYLDFLQPEADWADSALSDSIIKEVERRRSNSGL
jgi:hypothetical protein